MSLSKECQDYHLTLDGWVKGSFEADILGGPESIAIPEDRVLTIKCYEELKSPHYASSKPIYYDRVEWQSDDKQLIRKLQQKWGDLPPDWIELKER